ncbi:MAG: FtsX-like permease family protein [Patescibacteria group bacterium]
MRAIDVVRISSSNLRGSTMRTALTVTGIGVGIATIVFLVSLGYGLQDLSMRRIASIGAVTTLNVSAGKISSPDKAFAEKYQSDARVEKVVVVNSVPVKGTFSGTAIDAVANIVPGDFFGLEGLKPEAGDFYGNETAGGTVISTGFAKGVGKPIAELIGQEVAMKLFVKDAATSKVVPVDGTYKVYGAYLDDATAAAYLTPDTLKKTGNLAINQVKVKLKSKNDLVPVKSEIEGNGYSVSSVADTIGQLDLIFNIIKIILAVFGGVALVVASIGMFNTMTIALLERTRDVGIMKSTGTDDSAVYLIFLTEAILISGLGGAMGLALGWVTTIFVNFAVNSLARSVGGEAVDLFTTPMMFVIIMLAFSFLVGVSTGFLPARRASRLNPLEALRYE